MSLADTNKYIYESDLKALKKMRSALKDLKRFSKKVRTPNINYALSTGGEMGSEMWHIMVEINNLLDTVSSGVRHNCKSFGIEKKPAFSL